MSNLQIPVACWLCLLSWSATACSVAQRQPPPREEAPDRNVDGHLGEEAPPGHEKPSPEGEPSTPTVTALGRPAEGPYASFEEVCGDDDIVVDQDDPMGMGGGVLGPMGPIRSIRFLGCVAGPYGRHRLVFESNAGLYVSHFAIETNMAVSGAQTSTITVAGFALEQVVPGGPPEVLLRIDATYASGGSSPDWYENSVSELYVCGIGQSGTPSCTDAIPGGSPTADELSLDLP